MSENHLIKQFNDSSKCVKCDNILNIYQPNYYKIIACPICFHIQSKIKPELYSKINNKWDEKIKKIKLYSKGKIEEFDITVIGIAIKKNGRELWTEYQLIDQFSNNHIITEWKRHYHYLKLESEDSINLSEFKSKYNPNLNEVTFKGVDYKKIEYYYASTYAFIGEFTYDLIDVEKIKCIDYTNPPYLLSVEFTKEKIEVFKGRYISHKEIQSIFRDQIFNEPDSSTVGMAQPFFNGISMRHFNLISIYFFFIFTLYHFLFNSINNEKILLTSDNPYTTDKLEIISKPFTLKKQFQSYYLAFEGQSSLSNQWIEDQITLVNENTGEEREFSLGLEYYSGYDGGYSWSEGSNYDVVNISDVQPGKYHIKEKMISSSPEEHLQFRLEVKTDTPNNWNYGLILITFIIIVLITNRLYAKFEEKRTGF